MEKISIGVAGFGKQVKKVHLPTIASSPYCSLTAIASRHVQSNSHLVINEKRVDLYSDYMKLIKSPAVDAVIISTSNNLHGSLTIEALSHGKHVLCEKPLSWQEDEIKEISSILSSNKKLILVCGFMYRHHPLYHYINQEIDMEGPAELIVRFHYPPVSDGNIRSKKSLGGGALLDVGCYVIDVAQYLLRFDPDSVSFSYETSNDTNCDIQGLISMGNKRNTLYGSFSQCMPRNQQLQIWSETAGIECTSPFLIPRTKHVTAIKTVPGGARSTKTFPICNPYQNQINLFAESILSGEILTPLTSGIRNAKILARLHRMIKN